METGGSIRGSQKTTLCCVVLCCVIGVVAFLLGFLVFTFFLAFEGLWHIIGIKICGANMT